MCVVSPEFFYGHLNGAMFLRFIRHNSAIFLEDIPLSAQQRIYN